MYVSIWLKVLKILSKMRQNCKKKSFALTPCCVFLRHLDFSWVCNTGMSYFRVNLEQCSAIALWSELKKKIWSKSGRPYDSCPKAKNLHGLIAWNILWSHFQEGNHCVYPVFFLVLQLFFLVGWGDLFLAWNLRKPDGGGGQFSKKKLRFAVFWHVWHLNAKFMKYFAIVTF